MQTRKSRRSESPSPRAPTVRDTKNTVVQTRKQRRQSLRRLAILQSYYKKVKP